MTGKLIFILALAAGAASFACAARAESAPPMTAQIACGSGYHVYVDGSCQPDNMSVDSRCPNGFVTQPFPNGQDYRCVPQSWSSSEALPG